MGMTGFSWADVGEDVCCGGWLAILKMCPSNLILMGRFMFVVKFFDEKD